MEGEVEKTKKPKGFRKGYKGILTVSFDTYIMKVFKTVHPDLSLKSETLATVNNIIRIMAEKIMKCVNLLMTLSSKKKTISIMEIQTATRLIFPGELAKHAVAEGTRAVTRFRKSLDERKDERKTLKIDESGKKKKLKKMTRTSMAGLSFPVSRVENIMKQLSISDRKGASSAVYFAAILEYIAAEILELAGNIVLDIKRARVRVRDVTLAVKNDEELAVLFEDVIFGGGVVPYIEEKLLSKKKKKEEEE